MAASEGILSSWKTPFSTPIRKDENACRDLFQNSEKLLASAVSICRLKGSVECQTGGLITVCEELQSLLRLAFSEIKRLEKHFNSQRSHFEDEITCLKERVKYLEEENSKHTDNNEDCKQDNEATCKANKHSRKSSEGEENVKDTDSSLFVADDEDSDPYLFNVGSTDVEVVSVHDGVLHVPPKEQKVSKSPQENKKSNSKKRLKKLASKKAACSTDSVSEGEDLDALNTPSGVSEVNGEKVGLPVERKSTSTAEMTLSNEEMEEDKKENEDAVGDSKGDKEKTKVKKTKKKKGSATFEESDRNSQDKMPVVIDNGKHREEVKDTKKGKKRSVTKEEFDDVLQEETPGDDVFQEEAKMKTKGKKKKESPVSEKPQRKSNQKLSLTKKSKSSSDDKPLKTEEETVNDQPEQREKKSQKKPRVSTSGVMSNANGKSSKKESAIIEEKDEQLGDMSFFINVNSQISIFVADASQQECELQPMSARERNDVYKVAHLYKVRARIGTKTENNLTTVRLSKHADTRMPKPGRVDSLLSELSIAASKAAVKDSPKNQVKRKHTAHVEGNEETVPGDGLDNGPPKKKLSKLSKSNKE